MTKKQVLVLLLSLLSTPLMARKIISFGVKGGLISENISPVHRSSNAVSLGTSDRLGFQVGLVTRIDLRLFYIQPEIVYNRISYQLTLIPNQPQPTIGDMLQTKVRMNTIEIPILFGTRISFFRSYLGPVFNLMVDASSAKKTMIDIWKPTVSFQVGIGATFGGVNLDVRYHGQFVRPEQSLKVADLSIDSKMRMRRWEFSVGYMF